MSTPKKNPPSVNTSQDPGLEYLNQREIEVAITPTENSTKSVVYEEVTQVITNVFQVNAPSGANGQLQFNQNGQYIGDTELQYNPNTDTLTTGTIIANTIRITGNANNLKLNGGNNNDVLKTDGNGNLSWANVFPSVSGNTGKFLVTNGVSIDWSTTNYNSLATTTYVSSAIANLAGTAPAMLDTLGEIANIIGQTNDPQYGIISQLANKANISNLAQVAFSGSYSDLSYKPTISTAGTTGNYADLNGKPTIPATIRDLGISEGTNGQVLTTNGNGNYSFTTVASGSSFNQSLNTSNNVTFNSVVTGNISYSNANLEIYTSANSGKSVDIYTDWGGNNGGVEVWLKHNDGVEINTKDGDYSWKFAKTGALLFPQTPNITAGIVVNDNDNEFSISSDRGNISIWPENSKWLFGADGNLTLPSNTSNINYANGTSILSGGFSGNYSDLSNKPNLLVYATAANLSTLSNSVANITWANLSGAPNISNYATNSNVSNVSNTVANITWANLSGAPTIPTSFSNLVNGSKTVSLGSDGNLTLPQGSIIGETATTTVISPPNGLAGQSLVIRPTGATGIISDHPGGFADGDTVTLTVTPDYNYNTVTGTVDYTFTGTGVTSQTLGRALTGTLTFTNETAKPISWTIPVASTMTTFTITLSNASGFDISTIQPLTLTKTGSSEDHHIHLIAGDPSITDIYLGDDDQYVKIEKNGGNVIIGTDTNSRRWTFDTNGNLTLPDTTSVIANVSITLEANDTGNITGLSVIGDSNANLYAHGNVTIVSDSSNTTATWTFGKNGRTTFPTGLTLSNARGPNTVNFTSAIDKEFQIETQTSSTGKLWRFGTDGNLTLPAGGDIKNSSGTSVLGTTLYLLEAYASVTYTLPGSFTEDVCRYSVVSSNVNVSSGWFDTSTYTFTPQQAGYWEITASYDIYRNNEASMAIKKNNSLVAAAGSFGAVAQQIRKIVYLNGSTDYINIVNVGGSALQRAQFDGRSWFQARWVGA